MTNVSIVHRMNNTNKLSEIRKTNTADYWYFVVDSGEDEMYNGSIGRFDIDNDKFILVDMDNHGYVYLLDSDDMAIQNWELSEIQEMEIILSIKQD